MTSNVINLGDYRLITGSSGRSQSRATTQSNAAQPEVSRVFRWLTQVTKVRPVYTATRSGIARSPSTRRFKNRVSSVKLRMTSGISAIRSSWSEVGQVTLGIESAEVADLEIEGPVMSAARQHRNTPVESWRPCRIYVATPWIGPRSVEHTTAKMSTPPYD